MTGLSSLPPHLLLVLVSHLHHHLQVTISTCSTCTFSTMRAIPELLRFCNECL